MQGSEIEHPFRNNRVGTVSPHIFDVKNPIPEETKDASDVQRFFNSNRIVPFATNDGSTGDKLLSWYQMIARLSPTTGACVDKLTRYVIGSKAIVEAAEDPEYETGDVEVSESEAAMFIESLKNTVSFEGGVIGFHESAFRSLKNTGNVFAELSMTEKNGVVKALITFHKTSSVRYKVTEPEEPRVVLISPVWTQKYIRKNPPKKRPVFPVFVTEGGVTSTVFHLKSGDNDWYGRPDSDSSILYKYREVQDAVYLIKQSSANFVGQLIIEVEEDTAPAINEEDARESGFDSFAERLEQNFTMKGEDPQAIMALTRPIGSRPMTVFQVKPNTNENWYKVTGEINQERIIMSFGLTRRFMGLDAGAGLSDTAFLEDYITNVDPVVRSNRSFLLNWTNRILSEVWDFAGKPDMNKYSLGFKSPLQEMVSSFRESKLKENDNSTD